jgi:Raf kinase inhibitor-like YbhB/YbcL family protein
MKITSPDFPDGGFIPDKFAYEGENKNPTLMINGIPEGTESMAIVVDDPDAPTGTFVHWLNYDVPPVNRIGEGDHLGKEGENDFGHNKYDGPRPPSGTHRYRFKVYALDKKLGMPPGQHLPDLQSHMSRHILDSGILYGRYERRK